MPYDCGKRHEIVKVFTRDQASFLWDNAVEYRVCFCDGTLEQSLDSCLHTGTFIEIEEISRQLQTVPPVLTRAVHCAIASACVIMVPGYTPTTNDMIVTVNSDRCNNIIQSSIVGASVGFSTTAIAQAVVPLINAPSSGLYTVCWCGSNCLTGGLAMFNYRLGSIRTIPSRPTNVPQCNIQSTCLVTLLDTPFFTGSGTNLKTDRLEIFPSDCLASSNTEPSIAANITLVGTFAVASFNIPNNVTLIGTWPLCWCSQMENDCGSATTRQLYDLGSVQIVSALTVVSSTIISWPSVVYLLFFLFSICESTETVISF
eukprot:GHVL01044329.1.p1 GENE.GHVL01044329.1~~GHVL01044329.1.p1  ORF type:complete len:315 (-),score=21.70 GHVL01044329.1:2-946(-)